MKVIAQAEDADTTTQAGPRAEETTTKATVTPFDRLSVKGLPKEPPLASPYQTKRAEEARYVSLEWLTEAACLEAAAILKDAGIARTHVLVADSADHNTLTLTAALNYAAHGLHVVDTNGISNNGRQTFPSPDGCKVPRGAGWQLRATTDPEAIIKFWIGVGKYPPNKKGEVKRFAPVHAPRNVSIVYPVGCKLFALDIDGKKGQEALEALEAKHGPLPATPTILSGSQKGFQMIFRTPEPILSSASAIAPGIDIRGENGQSVAPPSVHPTYGFYEWEEGRAPGEVEIADAPDWLVRLALESSKKTQAERGRRLRPEGQAPSKVYEPRKATGESAGFEGHLAAIGDHAAGLGFNAPIYSAACSYFRTHGSDVDSGPLFDRLQEVILAADCKDSRNEDRYATEDYLEGQIERAREWFAGVEAEGESFCAAGADEEDLADLWDHDPEEAASATGQVRKTADPADLFAHVATFTEKTKGTEVEKFIQGLLAVEIDAADRNLLTEEIAKRTPLGKRDINKLWAKADRVKARMEDTAAKEAAGIGDLPEIDLTKLKFPVACATVAQKMTDQGDDPSIFHSNGRIAEIAVNERGVLVIEDIAKDRFKARVEERVAFTGAQGSQEAPLGIVNNVYHRDKTAYPPLHKVIRAPVYDPQKQLITDPGYHPSGVWYEPMEGVNIPPVNMAPTKEEARAAVLDFADLVADFRLDALTRPELISAVKEGRPTPSFCHVLSVGITPICRAFINGPTPLHLGRKMKPRTGASMLLSSVSGIATLVAAKAQSMPTTREEMQKTIVSIMDSGAGFGYFDNLRDDGKVDFGEFAAALTAYPEYTGRRLGVTGMVEAKVTQTWMATGNKTALSEELAERTLLITLDPQVEHPGDRTDFKYSHLAHVEANRGKYLHCLLTIIQYWISEGSPDWSGKTLLGGFEEHSKIVGGILETAGVTGFLGNREVLRSTVHVASAEDDFMDALIELHHGTPDRNDGTVFRVWGDETTPQREGSGSGGTAHPYARYRVMSIKKALEDEGIAFKGTGYAQTEDGKVIYPEKAKAPLRNIISSLAGSVREWGPEREESEKRQGRYIFEKAFSDKHSTVYRLRRMDL